MIWTDIRGYVLVSALLLIILVPPKDTSALGDGAVKMKIYNDELALGNQLAEANPETAKDEMMEVNFEIANEWLALEKVEDSVGPDPDPDPDSDVEEGIPVSAMDEEREKDEDSDVEMGQSVTASIDDIMTM